MGFPDDPTALQIRAAFGANLSDDLSTLDYTDISDYTRPRVVISRGKIGDAVQTGPNLIGTRLRNPEGIFSPRNIAGPYYGNLRRQTPLQVRLDPGTGMVTRGTAYVPEWPPQWTGPDIDDRLELEAGGILRRLGTGEDVRSALRRMTVFHGPVNYWPMEDGTEAGIAGSALSGGTSLQVTGTVDFATAEGPAGSLPLPSNLLDLGGELNGAGSGAASTSWGVSFVISFPPDNFPDEEILGAIASWTVPGHSLFARFRLATFFGEGFGFSLDAFDSFENEFGIVGSGDSADITRDTFHHVLVWAEQSGGNIVTTMYFDGVSVGTDTRAGTNGTAGIGYLTVSPVLDEFAITATAANVSLGHFALYDDSIADTPANVAVAQTAAMDGHDGELAADRFARLCTQLGVAYDVTAGDSQPMGPQLPGTDLTLLRECEAADEAVMPERVTGELGFDPLVSRYNIDVTMTLDYEQGHVTRLIPGDDDRDLVNRMTVTRVGGASATWERTDGPLGTDPDTGVGDYPDGFSRSLQADDDALQHATWLVNKGTVDEPRYEFTVDLYAHPELVEEWLACDIGSRVQVDNPPEDHTGPAPLDVVIEGYTEEVDATAWLVTLYAMPYRPYEVFQVETGDGNRSRIPAGVSTLGAGYDADDTTLSVTSAVKRWIDSATYPAMFPIDIEIAGEVMRCTAITGTGLTQTFTVTRGIHGVSKDLPSGSAVQLCRPPVIAL